MNNWTRIDDDTYISNTLVTCAEYQAFIDEMIAQDGEYFQPHHWAGTHFPEGHADKPILGVSGQAGREFCHWLNQRQTEWWFRLPGEYELDDYPIPNPINHPIGSGLRALTE